MPLPLPSPVAAPNPSGRRSVTLYVAARLPHLSETFVYREYLGLRGLGRHMLGASVHAPYSFPTDPRLAAFSREVITVYGWQTSCYLPLVLIARPLVFLRALSDARNADHDNVVSRLKHLAQAAMGIAAGLRLRNRGIEHVHAHMANVPTMVGLYIARSLGAGFSFTGHAADLFVQRSALAFKLREADFVVCISYWHRAFYNNVSPADNRRRPVIRCSVALPDAAAAATGRVIIVVARLVAKKGIDLLIHAFALAAPEGWTLRIIGDGPEHATLQTLAGELGCATRIVFEGAQPHATCLSAIAQAELFVLPCRVATNGDMDGIPVVLMEAMAAARPVIAGNLPTIAELIVDGQSGYLVPPDDLNALANAIRSLANDPDLRAVMGKRARARIKEEFADALNLDRLDQALRGNRSISEA